MRLLVVDDDLSVGKLLPLGRAGLGSGSEFDALPLVLRARPVVEKGVLLSPVLPLG